MDAATVGLIGGLGGATIGAISSVLVTAVTAHSTSRRERRSLLFAHRVQAYQDVLALLSYSRRPFDLTSLTPTEHHEKARNVHSQLSIVGSKKVRNTAFSVFMQALEMSKLHNAVTTELKVFVAKAQKTLSGTTTDKEKFDCLADLLAMELKGGSSIALTILRYVHSPDAYPSDSEDLFKNIFSPERHLRNDLRIVRLRDALDRTVNELEEAMREDLWSHRF